MNRKFKESLRHLLPRSLSDRRILSGPLSGVRLVTSWYDYPAAILGRTERPLLGWFAKHVHPGDTWLDIGAHYGYTAAALSRLVGVDGRVYAFEPMIASAGCLARTRVLNGFSQLTVVPVALGNVSDVCLEVLPEVRGMVDSSFRGASVAEWFILSRLDWVWPRICGSCGRIDGVMFDVQGMESEVLKGMTEILRKYKPKLAIELHKGVNRAEILALLANSEYTLPGVPIEPGPGESEAEYRDDRSYAFVSLRA